MADRTKIEWTTAPDGTPGATWNPITGCSRVSNGCEHCYAERLAGTRMKHHPSRAGLTRETEHGPVWTGEVRFNEQWLDQPLRWRRPRRIFVCAHGDLFHESVPDSWIDKIFAVMALAPQHRFQVLTKRAERMMLYMRNDRRDEIGSQAGVLMHWDKMPEREDWPMRNVHMGVSTENQETWDDRTSWLLRTLAAVKWVSAEPLLGPIAARGSLKYAANGIDWVVVGGESGPGARPMHPQWARDIRDQCEAVGVPFFFKQWGDWIPHDHRMPPGDVPFERLALDGTKGPYTKGSFWMKRVGKKRAGRMLDGRTWDGLPECAPRVHAGETEESHGT